jgi:cytochrome c biogenesis protein CcmG/thiol:disulfide interchange protein DsbE
MCFALAGVGSAQIIAAAKRKPAPAFTLTDSRGEIVKLSDYKGKIVLLNFWAAWCTPCHVELPWFVSFEQEYRNQGFNVVGVAMDEKGWGQVREVMEKDNLNYRMLLGNPDVADSYAVPGLPGTFLIDRDGKIASFHFGVASKATYHSEIAALLSEEKKHP